MRALGAGDLLVLCTDGLAEASDAESTEFDKPRLLEAPRSHADLPPDQLLEKLIEQARLFSNEQSSTTCAWSP